MVKNGEDISEYVPKEVYEQIKICKFYKQFGIKFAYIRKRLYICREIKWIKGISSPP